MSRGHGDNPGLDDVFYDPRSRELIVAGMPRLDDGRPVYIYSTDTGELKRTTPWNISQLLTMSSWTSPNKVRGVYKRDYYFAGVNEGKNDVSVLRHASGTPSSQVATLAKGDAYVNKDSSDFFLPRPSPNGRKLLWMGAHSDVLSPNFNRWDIVLLDIQTKRRKIIAHIPDARSWHEISPALGCPFSWSPKGDRVAYAYGDRIRIVHVRRH